MPGDNDRMHVGHRQRMRDRYRFMGLDGFAPHEALELLLFYVIPLRDVNPLAHRLIDKFGTLDACLSASEDELKKVPGVGEKTARFLTIIGKSCELYASFSDNRMDLSKFKHIVIYVKRLFEDVDGNGTWAICMDKMGRLVGAGEVSAIIWNEETVLKSALRLIIKNHASTLVLVDKRKQDDARVTGADVDTAVGIARAMARIGVLTIDMIIAAGDEFVSLRKKKLFDPTIGLKEGNESLVRLYSDWLD